MPRNWHPSIVETLPNDFPDLKHEFGKLESQMFDRLAKFLGAFFEMLAFILSYLIIRVYPPVLTLRFQIKSP